MRPDRVEFLINQLFKILPVCTALLLAYALFPTPVHATSAITWSSTTVASSAAASSTRTIWDYSGNRFALGYATSDAAALKFATSTDGSSWSSIVSVLSGASLTTADTYFTTSWSAGGNYIMFGFASGATSKYLTTTNGGSTWSSDDVSTLDFFRDGAHQITPGGNTYVVGRVVIGETQTIVSATTTASPVTNLFASSTVTTVAGTPYVDFAIHGSNGVVVHSVFNSGTLGVTTSTNMAAWTDFSFTPPGSYGGIIRPRVKFDQNGNFYLLYLATNNGSCSTKCDMLLSRYSAGSWTTEVIDTVGALTFSAQHDLAFINGTTPIITYYNKSTGYLRYAIKDSGNSGCSGTDGSAWTCGNVEAVTLPPTVSIATNNSTRAVIVFQSAVSTIKAAYGTYAEVTTTASSLSALPKPIKPTNTKIVVNDGYATSKKFDIPVEVSATNATEVALAINPDFFGAAWQPIGGKKTVRIENKSGPQYVYAKFTNATGGVSDVIFDDITYVAPEMAAAPAPAPATPAPPAPPQVQTAPAPTLVESVYQYFVIDDGVNPFAAEDVGASSGTIVSVQTPLCPERPNAFSLGGPLVRTRAGKIFLVLARQRTVCPVLSGAVARSWGAHVAAVRSIDTAFRISTPLPYRPGTIVQNKKTNERFFANTKGRLQWFPDVARYRALGYPGNIILYEEATVIGAFPQAIKLWRTDIHPDGTLFVLDLKKGGYAMLQNRTLHPMSKKTLLKFGENPRRAVRLLSGEAYPLGVWWK